MEVGASRRLARIDGSPIAVTGDVGPRHEQ